MFPLAFVLRFWVLFACRKWSAHALVSSHGKQQAAAQRRGGAGAGEIAGWTKIISCADQTTTNRMLFTAEEIMSMATTATRVKYCHYGSTTDCVTSVADSFPIVMLRQGGSTSIRETGLYCWTTCASNFWEDDDLSGGLSLPDAMWASCSTQAGLTGALTGSVMVHQTCNNLNGLVLSVSDTGRCCWKSGDCFQGTDAEAGVEMYIDMVLDTEIAGWTKVISCADTSSTNRLLFPAEEIQSMAELATRVKYCLYGSTTDCVTSMANTFPIKEVREGGGTSHDDGVACGGSCVNSIWEDDDPSTGITLSADLWASCGSATSGLNGATMLHQSGCNGGGLHFSVNDGGACCWYSGSCTAGAAEAGVEMYLDLIPGWTKVLSCSDTTATDRLLFPAAEIQSLAMGATQVKYCLYGSTTDCVTSGANTFPIVSIRQGGATSHDSGASCDSSCVNSAWSDDSPSTGITVPDDLWATCETITEGGLTGASYLHQSCNNGAGLHVSVNDGGHCCWFWGSCSEGEAEAGVEMYLNVLTASPTASPTSSPTSSPTPSPTKSPTFSPTRSPTEAPTFSPTHSPTKSPTSLPTRSPTESPTFSPTGSPTESPTLSPTLSPTESPTSLPTSSPTGSPTESPTFSPTLSPTESPTSLPTRSPTESPTHSPTESPSSAPTLSPTEAPTSSPTCTPTTPEASAIGDPHIQNTRGEKFDLFRPGRVTLLLIPMGAKGPRATKLRVDGHAKAVGEGCAGHYVDALNVTGPWARGAKGGSGAGATLTLVARRKYASPVHPRHKQSWTFGPGIRLVVVNGVTDTGVTYLNIKFQNLYKAGLRIGGLLGEDDYQWATQRDPGCSGAATSLMAIGSKIVKDPKIVKDAVGKREAPQIVASYGEA